MAVIRGAELNYLTSNATDLKWGSVISFAAMFDVAPREAYPPGLPPTGYNFSNGGGRVLSEYQITYIAKGKGRFCSETPGRNKEVEIGEGSVFILFPGEWHSYRPDPETGWTEYSIGFQGPYMGVLVQYGFYSPSNPVLNIGTSEAIRSLMDEAIDVTVQQKPGYQQLLSGIVTHILSLVAYRLRNKSFSSSEIVSKISEAKSLAMTEYATITPQAIAERINLGYSNFRRAFKEYTGVPPAKYIADIRIAKAKELLVTTTMPIKEIAFAVGEDNFDYFTTNFKTKTGFTPSEYRLHIKGVL